MDDSASFSPADCASILSPVCAPGFSSMFSCAVCVSIFSFSASMLSSACVSTFSSVCVSMFSSSCVSVCSSVCVSMFSVCVLIFSSSSASVNFSSRATSSGIISSVVAILSATIVTTLQEKILLYNNFLIFSIELDIMSQGKKEKVQ